MSHGLQDNPTILVVEDDLFVRDDAAQELRRAGFTVLEADSADDAIALLGNGHAVDLVLTDITLKGAGTGWQVAEAFRAAHPDLPVIYASGRPADPAKQVRESLFLDKPYSQPRLVSACRKLTRRNGGDE